MDSVILKDLRIRGLAAAGALLMAAACGGDEAPEAAATSTATDSAASAAGAPATAAAPTPAFGQQPAAPGAQPAAPVMDSTMTPAQAAARAASAAPAAGPVNPQALNRYQLTMPKLRSLVQAGQNIAALQARRPELRDSMRIPTMDPNLLYQKLNGIADARAAVRSAGISPEDYAIATSALIQATMVNQMRRQGQEPQGQFSEANARFVKDNWDEIQAMMRGAAAAAGAQAPN